MKKVILTSLLVAVFCGAANASDGGVYQDTTQVAYTSSQYVKPRNRVAVVSMARPCNTCTAQPVRVKTHTEVIDHYQVYQPVTVYKPVGTYAQRRIVDNRPACGCCGQ